MNSEFGSGFKSWEGKEGFPSEIRDTKREMKTLNDLLELVTQE